MAREDPSGRTYDVFISHAGPQKANFAVWLRRELQRHGVSAFLDERSLNLGDAAGPEMESALRSCSIVVIVLTPDFMRSPYCIEELHWALHPLQPHPAQLPQSAGSASLQPAACSVPQPEVLMHQPTQQRSKQPPLLLPVLYQNSDMQALQQDVQQQVAEAGGSGALSARLQQASIDLAAVYEFTANRLDSQGKLDDVRVDVIVAEVLRRLDRPNFVAPTYAVDLESRAQELLMLLQPEQSDRVRVLSLHGMGGIGKTTVARELFSRLSSGNHRFSSRIFLEVGKDLSPLAKQRQLIELLTSSSMPTAGSAAQQQQQLEQCTQHAGPLLLVLDDMWGALQRDALLCLHALSAGSRVILTGRDSSHLHPNGGACAMRPVEALAYPEAKRLLCQHAFAADRAPPEYDAAVRQALEVCGGLPLALQVVGAGMRSRSPQAAEDSIRHVLSKPGMSEGDVSASSLDVLTLLRRSYTYLPTDNHRHFFLDAALLMCGHPKEHLLLVWADILRQQNDDGLRQPPSLAHWRHEAEELWTVCAGATLISYSTPKTNTEDAWGRVQVHDCMVEMARAVGVHLSHPASWSLDSLSSTTRLPQVGSLRAHASRIQCGPAGALGMPPWTISQLLGRHQQCQLAAVDLPQIPAPDTADDTASSARLPPDLLYLRLAAAPHCWALGAQLLVLDVSGDGVCGHELPSSIAACSGLRYVRLVDAQLHSLPDSIGSLSHLEALVLRLCSRLQRLPDSIGSLCTLKALDVSMCASLQQLPDSIGRLSTLKRLDVSRCWAQLQVPDNVGSLASLDRLDVSCCKRLQQLPDSIGRLSSLKTLGASQCWALTQLPGSIGSLRNLERLDASQCYSLRQLPDSVGSLASLKMLDISKCNALRQLPDSIGSLASLERLDISDCSTLQQLPGSIGSLFSMTTLKVSKCCALRQLPDSISSLCSLKTLDASKCSALRQLPDSIGSLRSLKTLDASKCYVLRQLPDSTGGLSSLEALELSCCRLLQQLPDSIGSLSSLQMLNVHGCDALQQLPESIDGLSSLKTLDASFCTALQQLPDSISRLSGLGTLDVLFCCALRQLPDSINRRSELRTLDVRWCTSLQHLGKTGSFPSIDYQTVELTCCSAVCELPDSIDSVTHLKTLDVSKCTTPQQLPNS